MSTGCYCGSPVDDEITEVGFGCHAKGMSPRTKNIIWTVTAGWFYSVYFFFSGLLLISSIVFLGMGIECVIGSWYILVPFGKQWKFQPTPVCKVLRCGQRNLDECTSTCYALGMIICCLLIPLTSSFAVGFIFAIFGLPAVLEIVIQGHAKVVCKQGRAPSDPYTWVLGTRPHRPEKPPSQLVDLPGDEQKKVVTVRQVGSTNGGEQLICPDTIDELISDGANLLGIFGVGVRTLDGERISDVSLIKNNQVVYITTEPQEQAFDT